MDEDKEIESSEFVLKYLEPIPGNLPCGEDAGSSEEYFKLSMEIQKVAPDYKLCRELSDIILLEKSKDLRIAAWLCFALFRTDKLRGLKEGLNIIYKLLAKYQNGLFPSNEIHRSKSLQFLNTPRVFKLVEKEEVSSLNAADVIEADSFLSLITNECAKLFQANPPVLKQLLEVLDAQAQQAKQSLEGESKKEEVKKPKEENVIVEEKPPKPEEEKVVVTPEGKIEDTPKAQGIGTQPPTQETSLKVFKASSEKDALIQMKQMLGFFFEDIQDGVKKEKIPSAAFVFGILRQLLWDRLNRPVETDKVTQINAPNPTVRGKIREWFSAGNYDALIPRVEINCLKAESEFIYWLDAHMYVVKALEQKGGIYLQAAEDIKYHLSKLMKRIPDLVQMKFRDKQTPFAEAETIRWIDEEVKKTESAGQSNVAAALPPIMGEEYEEINKMYESAVSVLPEKFEENLDLMQQSISRDVRIKGRFLRKLNLANYCINAKQFSLAKVYLTELKMNIDRLNISGWEPALCTAVWESMFIVNTKLLDELKDNESGTMLREEQKELFSRIAQFDALLALKLQTNK